MGWNLIPPFTKVHLHYGWCVDWVAFVWINNNAKESRVCIDELGFESNIQVVKDRSIIEIGQISHVLTFLKFWWIDLSDLFRLEYLFLKKQYRNA